MRQLNIQCALLAMAAVTACGGGDNAGNTDGGTSNAPSTSSGNGSGSVPAKPVFASEITFGDSWSDAGTYAVGSIQAGRGGKYTINGDGSAANAALTGKIWTEVVASQLKLAAPCPAQTGLDGDTAKGFSIPVSTHAGCYAYAQGGARVSNPVGPGNKQTGSALGQLTVPVVTQVANHLAASNGKFKGDELVLVMTGTADVLSQLDQLTADATAAGVAAGKEAGDRVGRGVFGLSLTGQLLKAGLGTANALRASTALVAELANSAHTTASLVRAVLAAALPQAGDPLPASSGAALDWPALIPGMIDTATADATAAATPIAASAASKASADYATTNGPRVVTAMATAASELANLVKTNIIAKGAKYVVVNNLPDLTLSPFALSQPASTQALIKSMVSAFNDQLGTDLASQAGVVLIDVAGLSRAHAADPKSAGLTNIATPACGANLLGTGWNALACNVSNTVAGDVSHYMFADSIHPTPFEHGLIAKYVLAQMAAKGWQ